MVCDSALGIPRGGKFTETDSRMVGKQGGDSVFNEHRSSGGDDEKVLETDDAMVVQHCKCPSCDRIVPLNMVTCTLCVLYILS